jgi:hypothetical protein
VADDAAHELLLVGEVVVQRRDVDVRRGSHVARAQTLEPRRREPCVGGVDEGLARRRWQRSVRGPTGSSGSGLLRRRLTYSII